MSLFARFVAFDLETTGLDASKDEIVEVAGVKFTLRLDSKNPKKIHSVTEDTFESFIKPNMHMPEETSSINGITDEMLEDAPPASEILPAFAKFCGLSSILVAHNASFDGRFLNKAMCDGSMLLPQNPIIDSLQMSRKILPEAKVHKLGVLAKRFRRELTIKLDDESLHRALYDCEVLRDVFVSLLRKQFVVEDLKMENFLQATEKACGSPAYLKPL
jgi:DNA polymerase III subunit epsilon